MANYEYSDELYHYGRKGMKWGQNIFGRLRKSSRKRGRGEVDDDEVTSSGNDSKGSGSGGKKSASEMTIEELRERTDRLNAEKNYFDAERNRKESYDKFNPQAIPKESFSKKIMDEAIKPAIVNAGKKQLENFLNTQIESLTKGKVDPDSLEALKKTADKYKQKNDIANYKRKIYDNEAYLKKKTQEAAAANKAEKDKADAKQAAKKQVDDYNNSGHTQDSVKSTTYSKTAKDIYSNKTSSTKGGVDRLSIEQNSERYKATADDVVGTGKSKFTGFDKGPTKETVYDGKRYVDESEYRSTQTSNMSKDTISIGQNYVAGLLEDKSQK